MEVVSKLFKTELRVLKIKREEDKLLLLGDPNDPMSANSTMTAKDIGDMIGLAFSWDVLLYVLLFPFHYIGSFLKEQDLEAKIFTGVYVIANVFISLLLISSYRYFATFPFLSAMVFLLFSSAFLTTFIVSRRTGFLYPSVLLLIVAYYLGLYGFGIGALLFPLVALPLLLIILFAGKFFSDQDQEAVSSVLYWSGYTTISYFLIYILYNLSTYLGSAGWFAVVALVGYAAFYGTRSFRGQKEFTGYVSLWLFFGAAILGLSMLKVPVQFQGLVLVHLGILYGIAGSVLQRYWLFGLARPYYVVGLLLSIASFVLFYSFPILFIYALLIFSAASLYISETIGEEEREDEDLPDRAFWFKKTYFYAGNAFGYGALLFYCVNRLPLSGMITAAALLAAFAYLYVGVRNDGAIIRRRNQYLYLFGVWGTISFFSFLWIVDPFHAVALNMLLSVVPVLALLSLGSRFNKKGDEVRVQTVYESINLVILAGLLLPMFAHGYSPSFSILLAALCLLAVVSKMWQDYHPSLNYAPVLLISSVLFNLLRMGAASHLVIGVAFIPLGLACMGMALRSYRSEKTWSNGFYFGWILQMLISLSLLAPYRPFFVLATVLWAASFLLGGLFIQPPAKEALAE